MMNIAVEVPEDIGIALKAKWGDVKQQTLESIAIQAFRTGAISHAQVQNMLNLPSRWATDKFLKDAECYLDYTIEDIERDVETMAE